MSNSSEIQYKRWGKVVITSQLIIACFVFLTEVVNNVILYVTRSQGYGPDTIVSKLLRYLILTSFINFGMVLFSKIVERKVTDETLKRFLYMLFTSLICTDVAFSHYQFATTLAIFSVPIITSILYEDWALSIFTLIISLIGQSVAVLARAYDPLYKKDIGPEAAIAYTLTITIFIFAKLIYSTLDARRSELKEAVISAEKANLEAEKMVFSLKMLETLTGTLDAKDKYTNGHSMRVAKYSTQLASELGWTKEQITKLRYEALLHDIGKIGVPDMILNKPSKLTNNEFDLIKSHTVIGADILKNMVALPEAYEVAKHHHERYDGNGYPGGLKVEEIPLNARIVCIADAYDAMNSDRIYRKALSQEVIREELVKARGSQFDPELLDAFLVLFDSKQLDAKVDDFYLEGNETQQNVMEDIENVINKLSAMDQYQSSANDFEKFYKYMRNIGIRYNRSIEVLSVDLHQYDGAYDVAELNRASDALEIAIKKNIRAVDIFYKYSVSRYMLILLDAGVENVEVIQRRIQYDYNMNELSKKYELLFSLNESIEAPNQW